LEPIRARFQSGYYIIYIYLSILKYLVKAGDLIKRHVEDRITRILYYRGRRYRTRRISSAKIVSILLWPWQIQYSTHL